MTQSELTTTVPRADGMPMLGLGTWENDKHDQCAESVRIALEEGYRHIDTAQGYGNEAAVGEGIAAADVDRDEVFLATKIYPTNLSYDDVISTTKESLSALNVDRVDLLYVHWPAKEYQPEDTLSAFNELHYRGFIDRVGVSNFQPQHVERALHVLDEPIFANQVELHPLLQQTDLRTHSEEHGYELVAYSPLARGTVIGHEVLENIAAVHDVSAAQVSLAWLRERGVTAVPKATSRSHILDNLRSLKLDLTDKELIRIDEIDETDRRVSPAYAPWN